MVAPASRAVGQASGQIKSRLVDFLNDDIFNKYRFAQISKYTTSAVLSPVVLLTREYHQSSNHKVITQVRIGKVINESHRANAYIKTPYCYARILNFQEYVSTSRPVSMSA